MIKLLKNWPAGKPVPAISLRQPWASAVVDYGKDVENRSRWPFKHRGPLIIHASATRPRAEDFDAFFEIAKKDGWKRKDLPDFDPATNEYSTAIFPHGCIIGVANLVEVFTDKNLPPAKHEEVSKRGRV